MSYQDELRLANSCGIPPAEMEKIFREAAENYGRICEDVDALYRRKEPRPDEGETVKQMIEHQLNY